MISTLDVRPLLVAGMLTMLVMAVLSVAQSDPAALPTATVRFAAGTPVDATAGADAELPLRVALRPACASSSTHPSCPEGLPQTAPVIGRVSSAFGAVDGWLGTGGVDRIDMVDAGRSISATLEGDLGVVLGVYVAGRPLLDPAEGRSSVSDLAVPHGVSRVQFVVHNPTAASRDYRLVVD